MPLNYPIFAFQMMTPDYEKIIAEVFTQVKAEENLGKIADYIPELADISAEKFGVNFTGLNGQNFGFGDSEEKFSIQSISKVFVGFTCSCGWIH